jgi:uncharacterized protein YhfF
MSTPQDPAIERFLVRVRAAQPTLDLTHVKVRTFGGSKAMADVIVPLIEQGEKTGTFALAWEFRNDPAAAPKLHDLYVVTDFEGVPVLLYRINGIELVAFEDIGPQHVAVEGPNARDVKVWRDIHWPYWGATLRQQGREPSMQMPVIFHRYEVAYPPPAK